MNVVEKRVFIENNYYLFKDLYKDISIETIHKYDYENIEYLFKIAIDYLSKQVKDAVEE